MNNPLPSKPKTFRRAWWLGALSLVVLVTGFYFLIRRAPASQSTAWVTVPDAEFLALFKGPPDTLSSYLLPFHRDPEFRETFPKEVHPPQMDTTLDLTRFSLEQIRYLKNFVLARHGFLFMDMVLRAFFNRFDWYQPIWIPANFKPQLAAWEQRWFDKLEQRETKLQEGKWIGSGKSRRASIGHLVNRWEFDSIPADLLAHLDTAGFAVIEGDHKQLWNVYDQNQYNGIPSLVTPDIYLQLLHMHFKSLIMELEKDRLIGELKSSLTQLREQLQQEKTPDLKDGALQAQAIVDLAQAFLTGKDEPLKELPDGLKGSATSDFGKGIKGEGFASDLVGDTIFDWSRLIPRGHYDKNDSLRGYFRALKWLGLARLKLGSTQWPLALAMAHAWAACGPQGPIGLHKISVLADAFSGPRNGLSPQDLAEELTGQNLTLLAGSESARSAIFQKCEAKNPSRFHAKGANSVAAADLAESFVRVFPMRWSGDAEILQRLIEVGSNPPKRPFPSGLDVFAVNGVDLAQQILSNELKVTEAWPAWKDSFEVLRKTPELLTGDDFHSRRMRLTQTLFQIPANAPPFQQTPLWTRHTLVTALAGWTLQKQENILYQEQSEAAECGEGGGPPPPDPKGWVDPNLAFWEGAAQTIRSLDSLFAKIGFDGEGREINKELLAEFEWLADASKRELNGQELTPSQLNDILWIGGRIESLTFRITRMQPLDFFHSDEDLAAAAVDVYSFNGTPLLEATGFADELWAVVEIGGFLHLGRGAVFSHREWVGDQRLTDKKWHEMLVSGKIPARSSWQKPLVSSSVSPGTVPTTSALLPSGSCF